MIVYCLSKWKIRLHPFLETTLFGNIEDTLSSKSEILMGTKCAIMLFMISLLALIDKNGQSWLYGSTYQF